MNSVSKREKVFYIVMIIFYAIFPFTLFFDAFAVRTHKHNADGGVIVTNYYNLVNIKDERIFPFVIGIVFIVLSLAVALLLVMELIKGKFYTTYIKIATGAIMILLTTIIWHFGILLGAIFFMAICCNLFILSFDLKLNKNKMKNFAIYFPMYFIFLLALIFGVTIFAFF